MMGWLIIVAIKPLYASLSGPGFGLLLFGGLLYSAGTIFYIWRKVPYHHAIWHSFVLGGSASMFFCILFYCVKVPLSEIKSTASRIETVLFMHGAVSDRPDNKRALYVIQCQPVSAVSVICPQQAVCSRSADRHNREIETKSQFLRIDFAVFGQNQALPFCRRTSAS